MKKIITIISLFIMVSVVYSIPVNAEISTLHQYYYPYPEDGFYADISYNAFNFGGYKGYAWRLNVNSDLTDYSWTLKEIQIPIYKVSGLENYGSITIRLWKNTMNNLQIYPETVVREWLIDSKDIPTKTSDSSIRSNELQWTSIKLNPYLVINPSQINGYTLTFDAYDADSNYFEVLGNSIFSDEVQSKTFAFRYDYTLTNDAKGNPLFEYDYLPEIETAKIYYTWIFTDGRVWNDYYDWKGEYFDLNNIFWQYGASPYHKLIGNEIDTETRLPPITEKDNGTSFDYDMCLLYGLYSLIIILALAVVYSAYRKNRGKRK